MNKLMGMPKNCTIEVNDYGEKFVIENHEIVRGSLWRLFTETVRQQEWWRVVKELELNNFNFTSVIEQCSLELLDHSFDHNSYAVDFWADLKDENEMNPDLSYGMWKFLESNDGRKILREIEKKIRTCHNLKELYKVLRCDSTLHRDIRKRLRPRWYDILNTQEYEMKKVFAMNGAIIPNNIEREQLPESADIRGLGLDLKIRNHEVIILHRGNGMLVFMDHLCNFMRKSPGWILKKMQSQEISFLAMKQQCVAEMQLDPWTLRKIMKNGLGFTSYDKPSYKSLHDVSFESSIIGRNIADRYAKSLNECSNWTTTYGVVMRFRGYGNIRNMRTEIDNEHSKWHKTRKTSGQ